MSLLRADVGPSTIAFADEVEDMQNLVSSITNLTAAGGGDCPEYALDAILTTLRSRDPLDSEFELMVPGSQIVVLTDAGTLNPELESDVINDAIDRGVCIHFIFQSGCCCSTGRELYDRIASETGGTVLDTLSYGNAVNVLNDFKTLYRSNPCSTSSKRRKRQTASDDGYSDLRRCHTFHVSSLASVLRLVVNTDQPRVTVRKPSGATATINVPHQYGSLFESKPESGEWLACVDTGTFRYTANGHIDLDIVVSYLVEEPGASSGTIATSISQPACKLTVCHLIIQLGDLISCAMSFLPGSRLHFQSCSEKFPSFRHFNCLPYLDW